jgi:hypothetical protein
MAFNRAQRSIADELLTRSLLKHNISPNVLTSDEFKAFVKFISHDAYQSPSRYTFMQTVREMGVRAATKIQMKLTNECMFVGFCVDAWTRFDKHFSAITANGHGMADFVGCFDLVSGPGNAEAEAAAIHKCMLSALGLDPELNKTDPSIPVGKVGGVQLQVLCPNL